MAAAKRRKDRERYAFQFAAGKMVSYVQKCLKNRRKWCKLDNDCAQKAKSLRKSGSKNGPISKVTTPAKIIVRLAMAPCWLPSS